MAGATITTHGVMEGGGSYNLHAKVPAGGGNLALPYLEKAAQSCSLPPGSDPIVIADYGSSQGKNSLAPMRAAIRCLRARVGTDRPITVIHIDQHANDFNTLFDLLHNDPERYSIDDPNVFPSAIGRSFYETVLPRQYVDLGWCSYAAIWLSRIPARIPGHFISLAATGEVRAAFERQAAEDWRLFLSLRAADLRPGGRLVVVLPGLSYDGVAGFEPLFNIANAALSELVIEGIVPAEEREQMVIGNYGRRRSQLLDPLRENGQFQGLTVEHCDLSPLPDAAWTDFQRDGNEEVLISRHAAFFRAIFVPSLAGAISDHTRRLVCADQMEQKLKQRLAANPAPFHSFVHTMVLANATSTAGTVGPPNQQ
ncbi:MAG: SAM-dependent methyltransferase [Deltaproteobacteria bacterium]|nr:SAM-dependent methyltransferase [Deltaproteobacteria bacterium]